MADDDGFAFGVSNLFDSAPPAYPPDFHIGFILPSEADVRATFERLTRANVEIKTELSVGGPEHLIHVRGTRRHHDRSARAPLGTDARVSKCYARRQEPRRAVADGEPAPTRV